jgi:hypothetical protein
MTDHTDPQFVAQQESLIRGYELDAYLAKNPEPVVPLVFEAIAGDENIAPGFRRAFGLLRAKGGGDAPA